MTVSRLIWDTNVLLAAIAEKINGMETAKFFERRASNTNAIAAQAAWDKVGNHSTLLEDNWTKD